MKRLLLLVISVLFGTPLSAQVSNPKFKRKIDWLLKETIEIISVNELKENQQEYLLLDAREKKEFDVSHIANAIHIGYDNPDFSILKDIQLDCPIVVYCSIGYRSEKIGEKLQKKGYTRVKNLYGSIFEWTNEGYEVVNNKSEVTNEVHTYNKKWSKWVENPKIQKVY